MGFNPYSTGSYSGSITEIFGGGKDKLFQSLFYWKLFWKIKNLSPEMGEKIGFNPYSTGSYSGSLSRLIL